MADTARLLELQKIDSTWEKSRRRLLAIQKAVAEPESIVALRSHAAESEAQVHGWQAKQKNAELESQSLRARIHASEKTLMSGSVRNPKELEALQASIDSMRRRQANVDEEGLLALLEVEQGSAALGKEKEELESAERGWKVRHAELLSEEAKLKRQGVQLRAQRSAVTAAMPAGEVAIYEDLRKRKGGVAVAGFENGLCGACQVRLPTGVVSAARGGRELVYCPSCGRILTAG